MRTKGQKDNPIVTKSDLYLALARNGGNVVKAAKELGISYNSAFNMYDSYKYLDSIKNNIPIEKPTKGKFLFVPRIPDFNERFIELKQYRVDNYIPTVGDYFLPNGQKV